MKQFYTRIIVECPCGLVVKCKCVSLYQLQYCNIACVLDYKPLLFRAIRVDALLLLLYIIINLFYHVLKKFCFVFVWCPCMAINVSVQHNVGFLPGIILLTQCCYHRGTRLNAIKRFCICRLIQLLVDELQEC